MKGVTILFENEELIIINKQSGVPVQGGKGISSSIDENLSKELGYKIHLVHRLDRDTEGLMCIAKNAPAAAKWTKIIQSHQVKKEYTALCIGLPVLGNKVSEKGSIKSTIEAHGRLQEAVLNFDCLKKDQIEHEGETIPLNTLHVTLGTGRMHQIRIQLSQCGAPIAGDDKHGNFKLNKILRKHGLKKLCLCSSKLTIPLNGQNTVFTTTPSWEINSFPNLT